MPQPTPNPTPASTPRPRPLPGGTRPDPDSAAAFEVCAPVFVLRTVFVVQAVLAIAALVAARSWSDARVFDGPMLLSGLTGTLMWLISVCALRATLARAATPARFAWLLTLGAASALLSCVPLTWFGFFEWSAPRYLGVPLAGAALVLPLALWLHQRAASRPRRDVDARLAELQSRIRPHFLFNALNTALALVRVDPARAEAVLEDLSELFRAALAETHASVTLEQEIELARRYLDIEQVRFGDRLKLEWALDPAAGGVRLPPLVLQPLVENAVRHGVEPCAEGGTIRVRTRRRRGAVELDIHNSIGAQPSTPGNGMALANVRERLRLMHDLAVQFEAQRIESDDGSGRAGFMVRIVIPLEAA